MKYTNIKNEESVIINQIKNGYRIIKNNKEYFTTLYKEK